MCTTKRFSGGTQYRKEEKAAACQNPHSKPVTAAQENVPANVM